LYKVHINLLTALEHGFAYESQTIISYYPS